MPTSPVKKKRTKVELNKPKTSVFNSKDESEMEEDSDASIVTDESMKDELDKLVPVRRKTYEGSHALSNHLERSHMTVKEKKDQVLDNFKHGNWDKADIETG